MLRCFCIPLLRRFKVQPFVSTEASSQVSCLHWVQRSVGLAAFPHSLLFYACRVLPSAPVSPSQEKSMMMTMMTHPLLTAPAETVI